MRTYGWGSVVDGAGDLERPAPDLIRLVCVVSVQSDWLGATALPRRDGSGEGCGCGIPAGIGCAGVPAVWGSAGAVGACPGPVGPWTRRW